MGINPNSLDEDQYIKHFVAVDFKLKVERKIKYNATKQALIEVANDLLQNTSTNEFESSNLIKE